MPDNNGIFTLVPSYFATPGTTIRTEQHNPVLEDIANALTNRLPRDGSAPMLGNLPMNNRRITGLAAAVNAGDAPRLDQVTKYSAFLNSASALSMAANEFIYASASGTAAKATITPFARGILDDADAASVRATIGLQAGSMAAAADQTEWNAGTSIIERIISAAKLTARLVAFRNANSIGWGQSWQNPGRSANTSYQNNTTRPIMVAVQIMENVNFQVSNNGSAWITISSGGGADPARPWGDASAIIPVGGYYRVTGSFGRWAELR